MHMYERICSITEIFIPLLWAVNCGEVVYIVLFKMLVARMHHVINYSNNV